MATSNYTATPHRVTCRISTTSVDISPVAVDVDFEDRGVVDEAVHGRKGHGWVWKDLSPSSERLICRDKGATALVSGADKLEQHGGFGLVLADVGEVVEDQQVEAIEPVDGGLERQFAAGDLKPLNQVGGACEHHAPTVFHQGQADGGGQMGFAAPGSADQEQVGAVVDPAVAGAEGQDAGLGHHGHHVDVEAVKGLAGQQLGLGEMACESAAVAFGDLVPGEGGIVIASGRGGSWRGARMLSTTSALIVPAASASVQAAATASIA